MTICQAVDKEVVHERTGIGREHRILGLSYLEAGRIIGRNPLHRRQRVVTGDLDLAHVTHIEESGRAAHSQMLLGDAGVLHRHLPPSEGHPAGPHRDETREKRSLAKRGRSVVHRPVAPAASRTARTAYRGSQKDARCAGAAAGRRPENSASVNVLSGPGDGQDRAPFRQSRAWAPTSFDKRNSGNCGQPLGDRGARVSPERARDRRRRRPVRTSPTTAKGPITASSTATARPSDAQQSTSQYCRQTG